MMVKVFTADSNGRISFTPAELEKLLKEAYDEGKSDAYRTPYITTTGNDKWLTDPIRWDITTTANNCDHLYYEDKKNK